MAAGGGEMTIVGIGIAFFLLLGFVIPLSNSTFDTSHTELNTESLTGEMGSDPGNAITSVSVIASMSSIWFWSISDVPIWLDIILWIARLIFWGTIVKIIWPGG